MTQDINYKLKMNNGKEIPQFGLGVYLTKSGSECVNAVTWALEAGYRHIDTAKIYGNEKEVGEAVKNSGIKREDIFITTKLWNDDHGYESALKAFDKSLKTLNTDFIDLYLIHWPVKGKRKDSWKAFEKIYESGYCKSIGVSNYQFNAFSKNCFLTQILFRLLTRLSLVLTITKRTCLISAIKIKLYLKPTPLLQECKNLMTQKFYQLQKSITKLLHRF